MRISRLVPARPALLRAGAVAGALAILSACAPAMDAALDAATRFPNPVAVAVAPFAPPADAAALIGHSGREVEGWLGEPRLKRRDPPAEIWQYRDPSCVVDFFLYSDTSMPDGTAISVSHVEVRPREADARACFSAIRANGRRASSGG